MKLRPFFGYFGGKWRAAGKYYPAPRFDSIIEPFAGSAGYSLRYPERKVELYDLDPIIIGVWSYLIKVTADEILSLPDLSLGQSIDDLNLPQEAKWLIGFWLNKGGTAPCKTPSKWMREGLHATSFWGQAKRERIAAQLKYIRHWKVVQLDYTDIPVEREATWFVDPPYQNTGHRYRYNSKSIDYSALSAWCKTLQGHVIVCENEDANWLPFMSLAKIKSMSGRKGARYSSEVVWLSDSYKENSP